MTLSRDMSSNEHETNPMKMHIDKSQEVSSTVVELNRKSIGQMCKGFVLFVVIVWNAKHMTSRFAAPSMIYAPIRLHVIFQICWIFPCSNSINISVTFDEFLLIYISMFIKKSFCCGVDYFI